MNDVPVVNVYLAPPVDFKGMRDVPINLIPPSGSGRASVRKRFDDRLGRLKVSKGVTIKIKK